MAIIPGKTPLSFATSIRIFTNRLSLLVILKYKPVDRYKEYCVEIDTSSSVEDFRFQIFSLTDVEPESQRIILNGRWLKDNDDMNKLGLQAGQTIVMTEASNAEGSLLIDTKEKVEIVEIVSKPESAQGQTIPVDLEKSGIAKSSTVIAPNYHILKRLDSPTYAKFNENILSVSTARTLRTIGSSFSNSLTLLYRDMAEAAVAEQGWPFLTLASTWLTLT